MFVFRIADSGYRYTGQALRSIPTPRSIPKFLKIFGAFGAEILFFSTPSAPKPTISTCQNIPKPLLQSQMDALTVSTCGYNSEIADEPDAINHER